MRERAPERRKQDWDQQSAIESSFRLSQTRGSHVERKSTDVRCRSSASSNHSPSSSSESAARPGSVERERERREAERSDTRWSTRDLKGMGEAEAGRRETETEVTRRERERRMREARRQQPKSPESATRERISTRRCDGRSSRCVVAIKQTERTRVSDR